MFWNFHLAVLSAIAPTAHSASIGAKVADGLGVKLGKSNSGGTIKNINTATGLFSRDDEQHRNVRYRFSHHTLKGRIGWRSSGLGGIS